MMDFSIFSKLWDWSCYLGLLKQSGNLGLCSSANNVELMVDIRWCVVQIISLILHLSDRATANLGMTDEDAFSCLLRLVFFTFCQHVLIRI